MPKVASTTKATRTTSGSWRRWAAVPAATPASSRPDRGRTSGGRAAVDPGGAAVAGVVTYSIVAPRDPAPTRVITLEEQSRTNQGRMGAFPDGFRRPASAGFRHDIGTAPRSPAPRPPPRRPSTRRPGRPRRRPGPAVRPQLRRSRTDKVIGGVSGGLAEYSGIDALLWRVGFVALTLAGGTGVIVYLLLWLLMPAGPPAGAGARRRCRGGAGHRPDPGRRSPASPSPRCSSSSACSR